MRLAISHEVQVLFFVQVMKQLLTVSDVISKIIITLPIHARSHVTNGHSRNTTIWKQIVVIRKNCVKTDHKTDAAVSLLLI